MLFTAAAAAHHATLLFGSLFFALPVLALVLLDREDGGERISTPAFVTRTVTICVVVGVAIAVVLLPFWIALIHYPVTQTPIPHPSRANYILSPVGPELLRRPLRSFDSGAAVHRYRAAPPWSGFVPCFSASGWHFSSVSAAPPRWVICCLGRAFEVLTMERFSYWATLLALPFVGLLATELVDRFRMRAVVGLTIGSGLHLCAWRSAWAPISPADAAGFQGRLCRLPGSIATVTTSIATSRLGSATRFPVWRC